MQPAEKWLLDQLGYTFETPQLFEQALTHRSAPGKSYERLEFLGDAVLDFVASEVVFRAFPSASEGDLSRLRAHLVRDRTLAELASELGLGEFLALGSGERKSGGHRRRSILADALEAIFGAVFRDAGFDAATAVIHRAYGDRFLDFPDFDALRDPKTRLQEWLQGRGLSLPVYELVGTSGKAHKQEFTVVCRVDERSLVAEGVGSSRRNAEQRAARAALDSLKAAGS